MQKPPPPQNLSGKILYTLWNSLPRLILFAMLLLVVILMLQVKERKETLAREKAAELKREKAPINTVVLPLVPTTITERLNLPGVVEPWADLSLKAKIGGAIVQVAVEEGEEVQQGEIIAQVEQEEYRIAVDRAKAAWQLATAEYNRDKTIFKKGVVAAANLDSRKTAMQTAEADYDNARLQLSRTTITSPISGIIQHLDAKVGLRLAPGDQIARILKMDRMKGMVGIPESDVAAVASLDTVSLSIQALGNENVIGKKRFLSPAPATTARVYQLELELANPLRNILAGMFLRADIVKERKQNAIAIPLYAVISRNGEQYVFVEHDGIAVKKDVTLGIMEGWMVEVTGGLTAGDRLVVEGHRNIEDGQKIRVISTLDQMEIQRQ